MEWQLIFLATGDSITVFTDGELGDIADACGEVREGLAITDLAPGALVPEYDIASLFLVNFYCFVTKACARRPGAAASIERRRRERRTLLAGTAGELAGATRLRQARPSNACTFSA